MFLQLQTLTPTPLEIASERNVIIGFLLLLRPVREPGFFALSNKWQ
jgi:hypothetical protein